MQYRSIHISPAGQVWHLAVIAIPFLPRRYRKASVLALIGGWVYHSVVTGRHRGIEDRTIQGP